MLVSLYRKHRPQRFSEIVGQEAATALLRSAFVDDRLGQAYLFSGPRGCGKTTAARITAKAVNCSHRSSDGEPCCECSSCAAVASGEHLDVIEIDAASNRGIDDIRRLREDVSLAPMMASARVYILDEVHMLTDAAFNALLKTLEEPPSTAMFILATTEPNKVPVTIRSRCQHIPFHRISTQDIASHIMRVAELEGIEAEAQAVNEIARAADGALRDALSLAEQSIALGGGRLTAGSVRSMLGGGSRVELEEWLSSLRSDPAAAATKLSEILSRGVKPDQLLESLFPITRDLWLYSLWGDRSFDGASLTDQEKSYIKEESSRWTSAQLRRAASAVTKLLPRARWGLRSDVFAGLMLFDILGAIDEPEQPSRPAPIASPQEPRQSSAPSSASSNFLNMPMPQRRQKASPQEPPPQKDVDEHLPKKIAEPRRETIDRKSLASDMLCGATWEEVSALAASGEGPMFKAAPPLDAPLSSLEPRYAAALLDAEVREDGGELVFDTSRASALARSLLDMPRARYLISAAFGIAKNEEPRRETPAPQPPPKKPERLAAEADDAPQTDEIQAGTKSVPLLDDRLTMEERAAMLGADLLVLKPIDSEGESSDDMTEE